MEYKLGDISIDLHDLTDNFLSEHPLKTEELYDRTRDMLSSSIWSNYRKAVKAVNKKGSNLTPNQAHSLIWRYVYRDIVSRIKKLCKEIIQAKYEYYVLDDPSVSDSWFDIRLGALRCWNEFLAEKDDKLQKMVDISLEIGYTDSMEKVRKEND